MDVAFASPFHLFEDMVEQGKETHTCSVDDKPVIQTKKQRKIIKRTRSTILVLCTNDGFFFSRGRTFISYFRELHIVTQSPFRVEISRV